MHSIITFILFIHFRFYFLFVYYYFYYYIYLFIYLIENYLNCLDFKCTYDPLLNYGII